MCIRDRWDTDQFPNSVDDMSLAVYEILRGGGFENGGFMFDTKLRRQSIDRADLFHGHIGGIDTLARALLVAEALLADGTIEDTRDERYRRWSSGAGADILAGKTSLVELADAAVADNLEPSPTSGRQEALENVVNKAIWSIS